MEPYPEDHYIRQQWTQRFVRYALTDDREQLWDVLESSDFDGYYYFFCNEDIWDEDAEKLDYSFVRTDNDKHCPGC